MHARRSLVIVLVAVALAGVSSVVSAAAPNVVATSPVRHAFAPASSAVSITFDQPILHASVTTASLRVFGRASGAVMVPATFSNGDKTVTITPSRPFSAGETVLVNLSHDIQAADATPLRASGYAFEFVVSTQPANRDFAQIDEMTNRIGGGQTRIYGAVATDFDGDGWIDLGTVNEVSADVRVFMNRGDGSGLYDPFLQPPFPVGVESSPNEPADVDNDGKTDAVVSATNSGGVWVAYGAGDGTFDSSQSILTGSEPHGVAVLDVDGDGDLDIVEALQGSDEMALMLNNGSGTFGAPTFFDSSCSGEWGLASGDMDDDGITDLVVGCVNDQRVSVMLGNGDGTFTVLPSQNAGGQPWQVALGDVNGDGELDAGLANALSSNGGGLLIGNGDGTFDPVVQYAMPGHTPASDFGDLDGDGDLDWVLSSFGAGLWRIYLNDGTGTFTLDQDISAASNPSCSVLLDIDNDGDLDMALSDEIADTVRIMQNGNGPSPLCPPAPVVCREPFLAGKASLLLKDKTPDKGDQLQWKWVKGPTTPLADYGDPLTADDYALCLYDNDTLLTSADANAGGFCRGKPCWSTKPTSIQYKNKDASTSGTVGIKLKEGLFDGKASILVKAKGAKIALPTLGAFTGPIVVQLHRSGGGRCFGASYSAPFLKSDTTIFKDKAD